MAPRQDRATAIKKLTGEVKVQQRLSKHRVSIFNDFLSFCTKGVNDLIHILSSYKDKIAGPVAERSKE